MKSPLHEAQQALGAAFKPSGGLEMVRSYGNPTLEHQTVRKHAGLIDQSHRGKLRLKGKDRADFLHGMATNDIKKLTPGSGLYAAFTNDKAKMLSDARIYCLSDAFWIDLEPEATEKTQKHLDKYTLASDVVIENQTESYGLLSIYGPTSHAIITHMIESQTLPTMEYSIASFSMDGVPVLAARNEITGEPGYDLYIPVGAMAAAWNRLMQAGGPHGLRPVGLDALDSLRIEAGIPRYGIDMDDSNFPMEAGLEKRAISYTKGCYIGQETIARADALGRMNKRLMGLVLTSPSVPTAGQPILAPPASPGAPDRVIGAVTSAVLSPTLQKAIAMGYLHRDFTEPGKDVVIEGRPAKVVSLPFYNRPH
ncbi:MAG TPA: aminomethyltransferase family protein [Nitrospiria bacterium]|nr:aminomethyltransferase family protein [Nitrospiria bacterium]